MVGMQQLFTSHNFWRASQQQKLDKSKLWFLTFTPFQKRIYSTQASGAIIVYHWHSNTQRAVTDTKWSRTLTILLSLLSTIKQMNKQFCAEIPKIQTYVENGSYKMTLKLPNVNELCTFPLKLRETVRDLINDIRSEDPQINQLVLHYTDGLRFLRLLLRLNSRTSSMLQYVESCEEILNLSLTLSFSCVEYHTQPQSTIYWNRSLLSQWMESNITFYPQKRRVRCLWHAFTHFH